MTGLAYGCRDNVAVLDKFDTNGVSIFSFNKHDFADMLQYLLATNSVDIVAGNFNFDLLKVSENNLLLNNFMEHVQIVNK